MNGTLLCSMFAKVPHLMGGCGPQGETARADAQEILNSYIKTGENESGTQELLSQFHGLFAYLNMISEKYNLAPFDDEVAEAYWFGNELLEDFTPADYHSFLGSLGKYGLLPSEVERLQKKVPLGAIPHHTFHVLFVDVGRVDVKNRTPETLEKILQCAITWGKVTNVSKDSVRVNGPVLKVEDKRYVLSPMERKVLYDPNFVNPKVGDDVALHFNKCIYVLNECELKNLKNYTEHVIRILRTSD